MVCQSQAVWLPNWLSFLSGIPECRRRKRILVAIQGFVDESGTKDGQKFVFSALLSDAEKWAHFSDEWDACLKMSPRIQYFKMDNAAGLDGEFYGFTERQRDEKLRALCQVVNTLEPTEVSAVEDMQKFAMTLGADDRRPLSEYYFFPFHTININVAYTVGDMGITQPYEIFFDEHKIFGPRAKAWYPVVRSLQEKTIQDLMPIEPLFRSDRDVLPLQAADLFAWLVRQRNTRGDTFELSWLDEELSGVKRSRFTTRNSWTRSDGIQGGENDPEFLNAKDTAIKTFKEIFGFELPPRDKQQLKKMRGR